MLTNLASSLRLANLITPQQERKLVEHALDNHCSIIESILCQHLIDKEKLVTELSQLFKLSTANIADYNYSLLCEHLGIRELITKHQALPIISNNHRLTIAVSDPTNPRVESDFSFATNMQIELVLVDHNQLSSAIRKLYGKTESEHFSHNKEITNTELTQLTSVSELEDTELLDLSLDSSPISQYINQVLADALHKAASDIHIEPYEKICRIRLRCDGVLLQTQTPSVHLAGRLAARIKIMAKLDIAERRLPQDGRVKLKLDPSTEIDLRISTMPTIWGEKVVIRLLDSRADNLNIDTLGYSQKQKCDYLNALKRPQGMILITGPTGSGKTVSLYAGIRVLNTPERNISTAEDPVEINLPGVNQVQINNKIGFTFAQAVRTFLRQDPDIIMLGEIRDLETAEIAIKAAHTGHLVISTLHTNSASESLTRLENMGINRYNLTSSLNLVVAQRLVRRLCPHCKQPSQLTPQQLKALGIEDSSVNLVFEQNSNGCTECISGYSGRIGIYEMLNIDEELTQVISTSKTPLEIEQAAVVKGMTTLKQSAIDKLLQGITSFSELQRTLYFQVE